MKNQTILFDSQKNIRIAALTVMVAGFLFNVLATDSFALPNQLQAPARGFISSQPAGNLAAGTSLRKWYHRGQCAEPPVA